MLRDFKSVLKGFFRPKTILLDAGGDPRLSFPVPDSETFVSVVCDWYHL